MSVLDVLAGLVALLVSLLGGVLVADGAPLRGLLAGVNLDPNLATVGSLATLLWLSLLREHDLAPTPAQFFRWGLVVAPVTLAPALAVIALLD